MFLVRISILFLCLAGWISPVSASALKPFPVPGKLTQAQFEAQTTLKDIAFPEQDGFFSAQIRIPKNWSQRDASQLKNLQTTDRLYGYLAWFDAPGEGNKARPYLTVRSIALDTDVTAKAWLVGNVFDNAYNMRALKEHSFTDVESIYVTYDKLVTYTTWARATVLGPRIILTEFRVPSDTWEQDKDVMIRSMQSYKLTGKDDTRIEVLRAFAFLDVATFQYPESWILFRNIIRSPDFFRVLLFNAEAKDSPNTQISVQATRIGGNESMDTMKDEEQKFLDKQYLILGEALPAPDFVPPAPDIKNVKNYVYKVSTKPDKYATKALTADREYWLTSFDKGGTVYLVSMLIPARTNIYKDWARGTRAYQIIVETLSGNLIGKKHSEDSMKGETAIPFLK